MSSSRWGWGISSRSRSSRAHSSSRAQRGTLPTPVRPEIGSGYAWPRSLAALGMRAAMGVALCLLAPPLLAQSAPRDKLAKSIERVYGEGAQVDTVKVDTATVYRVSH